MFVFAVLGLLGFATDHNGVGIIALIIIPFVHWSDRKMNRNMVPRPVCPKSTDEELERYECECYRNSL